MSKEHFSSEVALASSWKSFLSYKAHRSHTLMAWGAVFIYPAFAILDYLVLQDWELFLAVRLTGALVIFAMLTLTKRFNFSYQFIGHFSCYVVLVSLMWMLSWMKTPHEFFIYALNAGTAFVIGSIFLLWAPKHSILVIGISIASFFAFTFFLSPLKPVEIVSNGFLVLFAIIFITPVYVNFRYQSTYRDFVRQLELNAAYHELKNRNFEINQRNFEILQQKEKLEELNAIKDRLFMIISHDFRSPLHSLKGLIVLLNDSEFISPEEFKVLLKGLKHNVDQTYDLLENLLLWSKSQMNGFIVRPEEVSVFDLVLECKALLKAAADKKGISIISDVAESIVVTGDADMIRLVLRNLMTNAIKFTEENGHVIVQCKEMEGIVNISVTDTGIGMDPDKKAGVFSHTQSKNGTHDEKGTGLGLMLCKDFVEKNHGKIWVESELGKGTTFTFSLPSFDQYEKLVANASPRSSR
jgi:signal transduction histidine kinase